MRTARGSSRPGGAPPGTPPEQAPPRSKYPPPWTEFLTHACENITLPQTSFAGGKYTVTYHLNDAQSWTLLVFLLLTYL